MSNIIPNYSWEEIRMLSFEQLEELPSCEIVSSNENFPEEFAPLGIFLMVPTTEYIKAICEARGQLSNTTLARPFKEPLELLASGTEKSISLGTDSPDTSNIEISPETENKPAPVKKTSKKKR